MNTSHLFIKDPVTKVRSVSLTLLLISFIVLLVSGFLQMLGHIESTSIFLELYLSNIALYFSRKINFGSKEYSAAETVDPTQPKVDNNET